MQSGKRLPSPIAMLKDYDAAMDEPMQIIYPEVLKAFPEAKFIYTVRDPEEWFASYDSIMHDIYAKGDLDKKSVRKSLRKPGQKMQPLASLAHDVGDALTSVYLSCQSCNYWGCKFGKAESQDAKPQCLKSYNEHFNQVKATIPEKQLLIYNLSDGWAPLCEFLGKPIPNQEFPHADTIHTMIKDGIEIESKEVGTSLVQSGAWNLKRSMEL